LSGIAASYGLTLNELIEVNDWSDGADHAIFPGDVIGLPDDAVGVSTTRPPSNDNPSADDDGDSAQTSPAAPDTGSTTGGTSARATPARSSVGPPPRSPIRWPTACTGPGIRPSAAMAR
jgi:hypothetical protein